MIIPYAEIIILLQVGTIIWLARHHKQRRAHRTTHKSHKTARKPKKPEHRETAEPEHREPSKEETPKPKEHKPEPTHEEIHKIVKDIEQKRPD